MSASERRRQQKLDKKKKKNERRKADEREFARTRDQRKNDQLMEALQTQAFGWPIRFRRLFFDHKPKVSEGSFDLTGADLHLKWFETQADRRLDQNGEVISALSIESCEQEPDRTYGGYTLRCRGVLTEKIDPQSVYGEWARIQPLDSFEGLDGEEYRATEVTFAFSVKKYNAKQAAEMSKKYRAFDGVEFLSEGWNIWFMKLPEEYRLRAPSLQLDRLWDLFFMLRLYLPRAVMSYVPGETEKRDLLARQIQIERDEFSAGERLREFSNRTRALLLPLSSLDSVAKALEVAVEQSQEALRALKEKVRLREAAVDEAQRQLIAKQTTAGMNDRQKVLDAITTLRRDQTKLDAASRSFDACRQRYEEQVQRPYQQFDEAMFAEFKVAAEFNRCFYRWQQVEYDM